MTAKRDGATDTIYGGGDGGWEAALCLVYIFRESISVRAWFVYLESRIMAGRGCEKLPSDREIGDRFPAERVRIMLRRRNKFCYPEVSIFIILQTLSNIDKSVDCFYFKR